MREWMNLIDKIIETFDGEIVEDNKWRVDGSNGKKYQVEWHSESFRNQLRGRAGARVV